MRAALAALSALIVSATSACGSRSVNVRMVPPVYPQPICTGSPRSWVTSAESDIPRVSVWRPYASGSDVDGREELVGMPEQSVAMRASALRMQTSAGRRPRHPTGCLNFREERIVEVTVIETEAERGVAGACSIVPLPAVRAGDGWRLDEQELAADRLPDGSPVWRSVPLDQLEPAETALLAPCETVRFHGVPPWYIDAAMRRLRLHGVQMDLSTGPRRVATHMACLLVAAAPRCLSDEFVQDIGVLETCQREAGDAGLIDECNSRMLEYDILHGPA